MTAPPAGDRGAEDDGAHRDGRRAGAAHAGERTRAPATPPADDPVLAALGWDDGWAAELAALGGEPARVTRVDRGRVQAHGVDGPVAAAPVPDGPSLVTGDWITTDGTGGRVVLGRAERRTALVRRDPAPDPAPQSLAANIEQVWIVHAADQPLRTGWLDRAVVLAHHSGAAPSIVITKADLLPPSGGPLADARALAPTVAVTTVSVVTGDGVDALAGHLAGGRTAALLGRSGAGKSSLVNELAGTVVERTAAVRAVDAKGRHTTTRRRLTLAAGGAVIDTPGVRALGLWQADAGLALAFPDVAGPGSGCRFRNCRHVGEPGCAVRAAVVDGRLASDRLARYLSLRDELDA